MKGEKVKVRKKSSIQRIKELISFIDANPSIDQIVKFLSRNIDPFGENSGVSAYRLNERGVLEYLHEHGFPEELDKTVEISIMDDNPLSICARTGDMQIVSMMSLHTNYLDATHHELRANFSSGMAIQINSEYLLGVLLKANYSDLIRRLDYLECMSEIIKSWGKRSKISRESFERRLDFESSQLTGRQFEILKLMKRGETNASIAEILGFSESLIKQETMVIFKKLEVSGRRDLQITQGGSSQITYE